MQILIRTVSLSLFCGLVAAQAPTIQVSVVSPLTVLAATVPISQGVGLSPGGFNLVTTTGGVASASMVLSPTSASAYTNGYQFVTGASGIFQFGGPGCGPFCPSGNAQCSGAFELLLTRPSPTPVQVTLSGSGGGSGPYQTKVDINADGSNEVVLSNWNTPVTGNYNLMVGPSGIRIRVTHSSSAIPTLFTTSMSANTNLQLTFTSGPASLDSYGAGCFPLSGDITQAGDLQLQCPAAAGSLVILGLGTTPLSVPLSFTPGCLLLLQPLVTTTTSPSAGVASFSFPGAAPPPGVSFLLQAGRLDTSGVFETSNGLTLAGL